LILVAKGRGKGNPLLTECISNEVTSSSKGSVTWRRNYRLTASLIFCILDIQDNMRLHNNRRDDYKTYFLICRLLFSGLEIREYGRRDPSRRPRGTL
jgi:hypothetical protein